MSFNKTQILANLRTALSQIYALGAAHKINLDKYESFIDSLESLWETSVFFYGKDKNGKYINLDDENYNSLISAYQDALDEAAELLTGKANPKLKELTKQICEMLNTDLVAIKNVAPGKDVNLPELIEKGRSVSIDLGDAKLIGSGNALSNRVPVEYTLPDGTVKKGFFTPKVHVPGRKEFDNAIKPVEDKYPEFKFFFDKIRTLDDDTVFNKIEWRELVDDVMSLDYVVDNGGSAAKEIIETTFAPLAFSPKEKEIILNNPQFLQFANDVLHAASPVTLANHTYTNTREWIGVKENERIDSRNAAVSMVAKLLGVNDLVAQAQPMTVISNGQKIEGTFMENAYGKEVFNLAPNDPLRKCTAANFESPEVISQIANTQVIDYICGNVDRHEGNFFMQFDGDGEDAKLTKLTLIDNDLSFGTNNNAKGNIFIKPSEMGIIDADMAAKVMALTESTLKIALQGYGISEASLDAAWERTRILQKQITASLEKYKDIAEGQISMNVPRVVAKKDMGQYTLQTLSRTGGKNQFEKFNDLAYYIREYKNEQLQKANNTRILQEKFGIAPEAEKPKAERISGTIVRDDIFIQPFIEAAPLKDIESVDVEIPAETEVEAHGGYLSSRKAVRYVDSNGNEQKGFFTAAHDLNYKKECKVIINNYIDKYPKYQDFLFTLDYVMSYQNEDWDIVKYGVPGYSLSDMYVLKEDPDFAEMLSGLTAALDKEKDMQKLYINGHGAVADQTVDLRNVAMSRMAELIGTSNIIANSKLMKLKQGNKISEGVFMETAKGVDASKLLPDDPMAKYPRRVYDYGQGLKSLAELQILDYLCLNTDRHPHNMTYQFEEVNGEAHFIGVQGFDNDLSFFAKRYGDNESKDYLAALNDITVISETQARLIENLDPMQIEDALTGCKLSGKERGAAIDRLQLLQQKIKDKSIEVVKDSDWDKKTLSSLSAGKNIFQRLNDYVGSLEFHLQIENNAKKNINREINYAEGKETQITNKIISDAKLETHKQRMHQSIVNKVGELSEAEKIVVDKWNNAKAAKLEYDADMKARDPLGGQDLDDVNKLFDRFNMISGTLNKDFNKVPEYNDMTQAVAELQTLISNKPRGGSVKIIQHYEDVKEQLQYLGILADKMNVKLEGKTGDANINCKQFASDLKNFANDLEKDINKYARTLRHSQDILIEGQRKEHVIKLNEFNQQRMRNHFDSSNDSEFIEAKYTEALYTLADSIHSGEVLENSNAKQLAAALLADEYLKDGLARYGEEGVSIFEGQHKAIYSSFMDLPYTKKLAESIIEDPETMAELITSGKTSEIFKFFKEQALAEKKAPQKQEDEPQKDKTEPQAII